MLLTKRTEADMGLTHFMGLILDDDGDRYPSMPDCVVINLGTNDFSTTPHPDKHTFLSNELELYFR